MNNNILKLKLYKPELETLIPQKPPYKKRLSPLSVLFVFLLVVAVFLIALKWESIFNLLYKPKTIYYGLINKIKYKPPQPDTLAQKQIKDTLTKVTPEREPEQINVIDSIKISLRWKRGIIDFLKYYHPGLQLRRLYSIDDEYIILEGTAITRAYLDTALEVSIFKGAGIYFDIIETTRTKWGVQYAARITKQPVERIWDDNFVSIPPPKRKDVLDLLDSLKRASGISGNFTPLDEENHGKFTRYLIVFKGFGSKKDIVEFFQSIDKLNIYIQILSVGIEFREPRNRLIMLMGLNYLLTQPTNEKGEQTTVQ